MWVLTIRSPNETPRQYLLKSGKTTLGRKMENDIAVADEAASRFHAEIDYDAATNVVTLLDLGSTNGTYVNQERLTQPVTLRANDQIRIGQYTFDVDFRATQPLAGAGAMDTRLLSRNLLLESFDRYSALLCDVAERLNTIIDLDLALSEVGDLIREAMGADKCRVILAEAFPRLHEMGFPATIAEKAVAQRAAVIIPDMYLSTQTDPTLGKSGLLMHIHSALCVPVMMGDDVVGLIYVYKTSPFGRPFDQRDLQLAVAISHQAALTIQRTRLLEGLLRLSTELRQAATRAAMFPIILDTVSALIKVDGVGLALCQPGAPELVVEAVRGEWRPLQGQKLLPDEALRQQVLTRGQVYINNEVKADPRFERPELFSGLPAVAFVPLVSPASTLGALGIGRKAVIGESEVRLLLAMANIAASAMHSTNLREQTEQRLRRLTALRTIDLTITASRDLRVTLRTLLEQTRAQLRVDAASILLLQPETQTLEYAASLGFQTEALKYTRLRLGESFAGRAAQQRQVVHVANLALAPNGLARAPLLIAEGFVTYYGAPLIAEGQVIGVLEIFHRSSLAADQEWLDFVQALAGQAAIAIDNATLFEKLQQSNMELALAYDTTLEGWSRALDLRDKETEGHTQRVVELTLRLARVTGVPEAEWVHIRRGAILHDIGKMGIPDSILLKPGPLTDEEWVVMRRHPEYAYEWLSPITYLLPALPIPYYHHEKWDGTGYPGGLKGQQIPLAARLFAVADVWDALCSDRPYHKAWPEAQALAHIREQAGKHFDPQVVDAFWQLVAHPADKD